MIGKHGIYLVLDSLARWRRDSQSADVHVELASDNFSIYIELAPRGHIGTLSL